MNNALLVTNGKLGMNFLDIATQNLPMVLLEVDLLKYLELTRELAILFEIIALFVQKY